MFWLFEWAMTIVGAVMALYAAAWVVARAFFDNKAEYNRKLLRQLEERK